MCAVKVELVNIYSVCRALHAVIVYVFAFKTLIRARLYLAAKDVSDDR